MSRALSKGMTPSVLDRLIDPESGGTSARPGYAVEQIVRSVQRDLEELLNARLARVEIPGEFQELQKSPLNFGLPDFGSIGTSTQSDHDAISARIEHAVERFEPRLRAVRVRMTEDLAEGGLMTLQFQIEAQLKIDPYPDVSFETILELTTGVTKVKAVRV